MAPPRNARGLPRGAGTMRLPLLLAVMLLLIMVLASSFLAGQHESLSSVTHQVGLLLHLPSLGGARSPGLKRHIVLEENGQTGPEAAGKAHAEFVTLVTPFAEVDELGAGDNEPTIITSADGSRIIMAYHSRRGFCAMPYNFRCPRFLQPRKPGFTYIAYSQDGGVTFTDLGPLKEYNGVVPHGQARLACLGDDCADLYASTLAVGPDAKMEGFLVYKASLTRDAPEFRPVAHMLVPQETGGNELDRPYLAVMRPSPTRVRVFVAAGLYLNVSKRCSGDHGLAQTSTIELYVGQHASRPIINQWRRVLVSTSYSDLQPGRSCGRMGAVQQGSVVGINHVGSNIFVAWIKGPYLYDTKFVSAMSHVMVSVFNARGDRRRGPISVGLPFPQLHFSGPVGHSRFTLAHGPSIAVVQSGTTVGRAYLVWPAAKDASTGDHAGRCPWGVRYKGKRLPHSATCISQVLVDVQLLISYSDDGGETWTPHQVVGTLPNRTISDAGHGWGFGTGPGALRKGHRRLHSRDVDAPPQLPPVPPVPPASPVPPGPRTSCVKRWFPSATASSDNVVDIVFYESLEREPPLDSTLSQAKLCVVKMAGLADFYRVGQYHSYTSVKWIQVRPSSQAPGGLLFSEPVTLSEAAEDMCEATTGGANYGGAIASASLPGHRVAAAWASTLYNPSRQTGVVFGAAHGLAVHPGAQVAGG